MLTKKDLENIGSLVDKKIIKALGDFWADLAGPYLEKEFSAVNKRLERLEDRADKVDGRLDKVETDVLDIKRDVQDIKADMPTKDDFKNLKKLEEIHRKELAAYA
ncbi:MAG: hypothetical protein M1575_00755 [Patescibacteria group bacterium]|nr:hypothetical protein [Patescibacteria group bacterium]